MPTLPQQLLAQRLVNSVGNIFGLLGALHPPKDMSAAYRSALSGQAAMRNNALEYLDNTLSVALRQILVPVLDSRPVEDKLKHADRFQGRRDVPHLRRGHDRAVSGDRFRPGSHRGHLRGRDGGVGRRARCLTGAGKLLASVQSTP